MSKVLPQFLLQNKYITLRISSTEGIDELPANLNNKGNVLIIINDNGGEMAAKAWLKLTSLMIWLFLMLTLFSVDKHF